MYRQETVTFPGKTGIQGYRRPGVVDWWILYVPAILVTACIVWWECLPVYIGYALSVFALAAVIGVARSDVSSRREKYIWGAICVASLATEGVVAYETHVRDQAMLVCRFSAPGVATLEYRGTTTLYAGFMQVVDQSDLDWLRATLPDNGEVWFKAYQHVPLGEFAPGLSKTFAVKSMKAHQGTVRYRVQFSAEDDYWWEDYQSVVQQGKPVQVLRIMRYVHGTPTAVYQEADNGYPRGANDRIDWNWASKEP